MRECKHENSRGPSPAMMEDGDERRVCNDCLRRFEPPAPEADRQMTRVVQPSRNSCWFAVFSMLTGVPIDDMRWHDTSLRPTIGNEHGSDIVTFGRNIEQWQSLLSSMGFRLVEHEAAPPGINIGVVLYNEATGWCHTVAQDANGDIYDPAPSAPDVGIGSGGYPGSIPVLMFSIEPVTKS